MELPAGDGDLDGRGAWRYCGRHRDLLREDARFVLDPLDTIKTYKDSSYAMMEEAARRGIAIMVHPVIWGKAGEERFPRYNFWNSFGAPLESSLAAMSIVHGGLLDRYPDMRILFTQGGGWIHFGVGRLNLRYVQRADSRTRSGRARNQTAGSHLGARHEQRQVERDAADRVTTGVQSLKKRLALTFQAWRLTKLLEMRQPSAPCRMMTPPMRTTSSQDQHSAAPYLLQSAMRTPTGTHLPRQ